MLTISDRQFERIVTFVRDSYGINLTKKRALIQGRLALDIERRGFASFDQYFNEVVAHPSGLECQHMIDKLSTNHTFFFREPGCFAHMREVAVPAFVARGVTHIDIWCAASSTGQECYTVAMVMEDALALHPGVSYRILGSDINQEVLSQARTGIYPSRELDGIPESCQRRYCCTLDDDRFQIAPALRDRIDWRQVNLAQPLTAFKKGAYHLILCRNVMIYFEQALKDRLTSELYRIVRDDGYVYVGSTETLDMKRTRFRYIKPSVFEKRTVTP